MKRTTKEQRKADASKALNGLATRIRREQRQMAAGMRQMRTDLVDIRARMDADPEVAAAVARMFAGRSKVPAG